MTIYLKNDQVGKEIANMIEQLYNVPSTIATNHPNDRIIAKSLLTCLSRKSGLPKNTITKNIKTNKNSAIDTDETGIKLTDIAIHDDVLFAFAPYLQETKG